MVILSSFFGSSSFKYNPVAVRTVLFPPVPLSSPSVPERERTRTRRKRRKVSAVNRDDDDIQSEPGTEGRGSPSPRSVGKSVVLENSEERFL